jgi:DNA-binding winged helix-turn-helix (wHTH) protein
MEWIRSPGEAGTVVRFGPFRLDVSERDLSRNGERLRVQDQPMELLIALIERPGRLVTRAELRERLWRSDTFVDFEHGVNAAVKRLRDSLGDSAEEPRFVETVHRHGYRFIAAVQRDDVRAPASSVRLWSLLALGAALMTAAIVYALG